MGRNDDNDDRNHRVKGSFGAGFGLSMGCMVAIAVVFVGLPIGCIAIFGVGVAALSNSKAASDARKAEEQQQNVIEQNRIQQQAGLKKAADDQAVVAAKVEIDRMKAPPKMGDIMVMNGPHRLMLASETAALYRGRTAAEQNNDEAELNRIVELRKTIKLETGTEVSIVTVNNLDRDLVQVKVVGGIYDGKVYFVAVADLKHRPKK